jgi:hypothetical protein
MKRLLAAGLAAIVVMSSLVVGFSPTPASAAYKQDFVLYPSGKSCYYLEGNSNDYRCRTIQNFAGPGYPYFLKTSVSYDEGEIVRPTADGGYSYEGCRTATWNTSYWECLHGSNDSYVKQYGRAGYYYQGAYWKVVKNTLIAAACVASLRDRDALSIVNDCMN